MVLDSKKAIRFIREQDLSGTPTPRVRRRRGDQEAETVFDAAKDQAQVVASGVLSFTEGVTAEDRSALSDSALLAQLVANKTADAKADPEGWFKAYTDVLGNLGWTLQEGGWSKYQAAGDGAEVHKEILTLLSALLGPQSAALVIITAAISALQKMNESSPWLVLFRREAQTAEVARFQVGLVSKAAGEDLLVSLLACILKANSTVTQVLFFKFHADDAQFKSNSSKFSINRRALDDIRPALQEKVSAYQQAYLSSILDIPSPAK